MQAKVHRGMQTRRRSDHPPKVSLPDPQTGCARLHVEGDVAKQGDLGH